jgi:hypothetical protein
VKQQTDEKLPTVRGLDADPHVSVSAVAQEFNMSRDTVQRRFSEASLRAAGTRDGYSVYHWADAMRALFPDRYRACPHCGKTIARP